MPIKLSLEGVHCCLCLCVYLLWLKPVSSASHSCAAIMPDPYAAPVVLESANVTSSAGRSFGKVAVQADMA